jgi:flagellar motor switch protein FliM
VLPLGRPATAPAIVEFEGVPKFSGRPGTANRKRALRLLSVIPKGEIIRDAGDRSGIARVYAP